MKLGIFGGTFNPIHIGHLRAAEEVRQKANLDKILFIPSGNPPLKTQGILPCHIRFKMVQLAIQGNKDFDVSDIEINDTVKSFSVLTIQKLTKIYNSQMFFILGIDSFLEVPLWYEPEKLLSITDFIIMTRPNISLENLYNSEYISEIIRDKPSDSEEILFMIRLKTGRTAMIIDISQLDVSSTKIRNLIASDKSIRYLVPEEVYNFITHGSLYK